MRSKTGRAVSRSAVMAESWAIEQEMSRGQGPWLQAGLSNNLKEKLCDLSITTDWGRGCLSVLYVKQSIVFLPVLLDAQSLKRIMNIMPKELTGRKPFNSLSLNGSHAGHSPLRTYLRGRPGVWWPGPWEDLSPSSFLLAAPAALSPSSGELSFSAVGERLVQWLLLTLLSPWPEQWQRGTSL